MGNGSVRPCLASSATSREGTPRAAKPATSDGVDAVTVEGVEGVDVEPGDVEMMRLLRQVSANLSVEEHAPPSGYKPE